MRPFEAVPLIPVWRLVITTRQGSGSNLRAVSTTPTFVKKTLPSGMWKLCTNFIHLLLT